ncbi:hypothetical protein M011DRAFT_345341 [Sporormia fimetaria CBS 119925]|uniref:Uncharacterized protein n=1 Tax=Sporormia fimetaria CBS 119925 TaxID=1340428 RepID=A0A6A6VCI6_9PLEO|nr:hypothetical protein M011DRAFT_345341 [Sporormia fimetaria CBS 119925]
MIRFGLYLQSIDSKMKLLSILLASAARWESIQISVPVAMAVVIFALRCARTAGFLGSHRMAMQVVGCCFKLVVRMANGFGLRIRLRVDEREDETSMRREIRVSDLIRIVPTLATEFILEFILSL